MNGEIAFNMFKEIHPLYGKSEFLLKRWKKYTIYAKSGSYVRSDNPSQISICSSSIRQLTATATYNIPDSPKANVYSTCSVYLYDYVIVSDKWFLSNVYTSSAQDSTPALNNYYKGTNDDGFHVWEHESNTWHNSPNSKINNFVWRYNPGASALLNHPVYGYYEQYNPLIPPPPYNGMTTEQYQALMKRPIYRDDGTYFEIVRGYPRNHYIHKRGYFSMERFTSYGQIGKINISSSYQRGRQTANTTIGFNGISDGSDPVQVVQVTNINLIKTDNIIYH
ncbi:MAG TPA: hypothetical protein PLC59_01020 [Bacteroidales bacterium]|nr:hypothetical protein [Bacteroidales bacterium]